MVKESKEGSRRGSTSTPGVSPRSEVEDSAAVPVQRLIKKTTPKGLHEVRNVLRWRVPNQSPTATEVKQTMNYGVDRPRSAPSASLCDPPDKMHDKMQRAPSFTKLPTASSRPSTTSKTKTNTNTVHKRHWMYLYDNLHRAVDEMYKTCEQDFSAEQCINVIHTLELCMEDFKRLVQKIRVIGDDEPGKTQRSIAWEEPNPHPRTPPSPNTPRTPPRVAAPQRTRASSPPRSRTPPPRSRTPPPPLTSITPPHTPLRPQTPLLTNSRSDPDILLLEDIENKYDDDSDSQIGSDSMKAVADILIGDTPKIPQEPQIVDVLQDSPITEKISKTEEKLLANGKHAEGGNGEGREEGKGVGSKSEATNTGGKGESVLWAERLKRSLSQSSSTNNVTAQESPYRRAAPRPTIVHRKFPSPPPKNPPRSPDEARLLQHEKQAKASKNRQQYVNIKKEKVALVLSRVRDVTERQSQKIAKKQESIEERQEKAEKQHEAHIDHIKRKATTENTKVDEIAYITSQLTETRKFIQQKRLEDTEARRQGQLEGKKKKLVVQAAKEEAVVERKKQIEHARLHMHMHNDSFSSQTAQPTTHRKSPSKSPKKNRTHVDMDLEARRLKRVCKYCNVELLSDEYLATHLSGRKHKNALKKTKHPEAPVDEEDNSDAEDVFADVASDAGSNAECVLTIPLEPNLPYLTLSSPSRIETISESERQQKAKAKKTKTQITQLTSSYTDPGVQPPRESPHKSRLVRSVNDLKSTLAKKSFSTMPGVLSDISRILGSKGGHIEIDLQLFRQLGGIDVLVSICGTADSKIPYSVYSESISLLSLTCTQPSNRIFILMTGRLVPLIDLFNRKILQTPEASFLPALATLLTLHFWQPAEKSDEIKQQIINYIIQICLFEKVEQKLAQLQTNVDGDPSASLFIEKIVEFLESTTAFLQSNTRDKPIYVESTMGTEIVEVFKQTNIVGILSLLASILLKGMPTRGSSSPPPVLPATTWSIIFSSAKVLDNIAALDFKFLQRFLGDDDHQVEMFHLLGHLLWYCSASEDESSAAKRQKLMNEIVLLAGYYALQNTRTQETFQWGNSPTILQLLCGLPFQYFSDPRFKTILFPTLIAVCFQNPRNVAILQQEMSTDLIVEYIKGELETKDSTQQSQVPARFLFKNRFPTTLWNEALDFFTAKPVPA